MRVLVIDPDPARAALVAEGLRGIEPLEVRHSAIFNAAEAAVFAPDVVVVAADGGDSCWPGTPGAPAGLDLVWRRIPQSACQLHEFAGRRDEAEAAAVRKALIRTAGSDVVRYEDAAAGGPREAWFREDRLDRAIFLTRSGALPPREWLAELFEQATLGAAERSALLVGRPVGRVMSSSPLICACRNVRSDAISAAIASGCATLEAVGEATGAGTTCGSCRPDIARRLAEDLPKPVRRAA